MNAYERGFPQRAELGLIIVKPLSLRFDEKWFDECGRRCPSGDPARPIQNKTAARSAPPTFGPQVLALEIPCEERTAKTRRTPRNRKGKSKTTLPPAASLTVRCAQVIGLSHGVDNHPIAARFQVFEMEVLLVDIVQTVRP
jgi:hypothetical protein